MEVMSGEGEEIGRDGGGDAVGTGTAGWVGWGDQMAG